MISKRKIAPRNFKKFPLEFLESSLTLPVPIPNGDHEMPS